jgi:hypothetical protein
MSLLALACCARYPMNEPAREGAQRQEKERTLLLIGLPCTRVNKGERKAGTPEEIPGISWKGTLPVCRYATMSAAMIPTIPRRIEHWPTSLIISGHEFSSSLSVSLSSSTESISSMSTGFIYFSSYRWDRRVK